MISWPYGAFWQFLIMDTTCAGETNLCHPSIYVRNCQHHQTPVLLAEVIAGHSNADIGTEMAISWVWKWGKNLNICTKNKNSDIFWARMDLKIHVWSYATYPKKIWPLRHIIQLFNAKISPVLWFHDPTKLFGRFSKWPRLTRARPMRATPP